MLKKTLLMICCIIQIMILTGCFGKRDIEKLSVATAIGVDKTESGYKVTAQIINPYVLGENVLTESAIVVYTDEGRTISEAVRKLGNRTPHRLFLSHFQVLAIGEEMAKSGIEPILYYFYSHYQSRHKYNIVVVKEGTAEDTLKIQTTLSLIPSISIMRKINGSVENIGNTRDSNMDEVINELRSPGHSLVLPGIKLEGDLEEGKKLENTQTSDQDAKINVTDLAVFYDDKLIGWLNHEESIGYNHIMGKIQSAAVPIYYDDAWFTYGILKIKHKQTFSLKDDQPVITIDYQIIGEIEEDMSQRAELKIKEIDEIQSLVEEEIKSSMQNTLDKVQKEYQSDIFGFSSLIHRQNPKYFRKIIENYDEFFVNELNVSFKVSVDVEISRKDF